MKRNAYLLPFLLSVAVSSQIVLAGGFPNITLPNLSFRNINFDVAWNGTHTAEYRFIAKGFTQAQSDKIKRSMDKMFNVLRDPMNLSNVGSMTSFQQCVVDKSTKNQNPNWLAANMEERRYVSAIITAMMVASGGKLNFIHAFTETKPTGKRDFVRSGYAKVGKVEAGMNTVINLNTSFVDKRSEETIAGTIMHEMMHNAGWTHPSTGKASTDYPGTFIKEAQKCLVAEMGSGSVEKSGHGDNVVFEAE